MPRRPIIIPELKELLVRNPDGLRLRDLMELIGVGKTSMYEAFSKMKGEIEHSPYGKYKLTPEARKKYTLLKKSEPIKKFALGFEIESGLAIDEQIEDKN